jgi:transcriptional regulator
MRYLISYKVKGFLNTGIYNHEDFLNILDRCLNEADEQTIKIMQLKEFKEDEK